MKRWAICASVLAAGVVGSAWADSEKDIIRKVDTATKALRAVYYEAEWFGEGGVEGRGKVSGKVWLKKNTDGQAIMAIQGEAKGAEDAKQKIHVASDGKNIISFDDENKTVTRGEVPAASGLVGPGAMIMFLEYNHPTPFTDELNADTAKFEDSKKIGDTDCHVIYVVYADGQGESRWYFGKEDNLPRRVDRIAKDEDGKVVGAACLQITKLDADPDFPADTFSPSIPTGYEEKKFTPRGRPEQPELLKVGDEAPDWELKTPSGQTVSLKSLRGSVVVLDFWATWCGPCKRAMPSVQKVHEAFKGKPVKIIGMNCWERAGGKDPAEFMTEKGYAYMLLLKADDTAEKYHVSGIPTFYVIGPDGKIVLAKDRFATEENVETVLTEAITKVLPRDQE